LALKFDENPMPDGIVDQTRARQMIKSRFGKPDDVAAMGALLLSGDGSFITAQTISIDGGVTLPMTSLNCHGVASAKP
jgi:NAD(P)-dependent dehydrogenase (short-subunit alcohol dehydrogenase family)